MTDAVTYTFAKSMHDCYSRAIMPSNSEEDEQQNQLRAEAVDQVRKFYEETFVEISQTAQSPEYLISWMLLQAGSEANRILDIQALSKLMEGYYCKSMDHSARSWMTNIMYVSNCDIRLNANGKHVRSCFKRGIQTCKDIEKEKLAQKWLKWEQSNGTAHSIQDCRSTMRKLFSYSTSEAVAPLEQPAASQQQRTAKPSNSKTKTRDEQTRQEMPPTFDDSMSMSSTSRQRDKHTLFIKNLSTEAEEDDIREVFETLVPHVQLVSIRLIRDKVDSSKRGIAFVDVETQQMAEDSLKLNEKKIKGKEVLVYISKPPAERDADAKTIFLNNLPLTTTETSLREFVAEQVPSATVEEIRLIRDQKGRVKGFAYIQYQNEKECKSAIEKLNTSKFMGRTISAQQTKQK